MRLKHLLDRMTSLPELMTLDCENCIIMTLGKFRESRKMWFVEEYSWRILKHSREICFLLHTNQVSPVVLYPVAAMHVGQHNKLPPFTIRHPGRTNDFFTRLHVWTSVSFSSLPWVSLSPGNSTQTVSCGNVCLYAPISTMTVKRDLQGSQTHSSSSKTLTQRPILFLTTFV